MNDLLQVFTTTPQFFIVVVVLFGLVIGSFLNVVIYRLPIMMKREWECECRQILELDIDQPPTQPERFDLVVPRSHCPACNHKISALENLPILSYLCLRGKCRACGIRISVRYPLIELGTGVLAGIVAWHYGFSIQTLAALFFTFALVSLAAIDYDTTFLPDSITLPFLWLGLLVNLFALYTDSGSSIIGAMLGYLFLWSVYWAFKLLTGKEGMGYGDFKLLAMLGAWTGWQGLLAIILLSSLLGAMVGISLIVLRGRDRAKPIPFGPFLAGAGWITLLWGDMINRAYLGTMG